MQRRAKVFMNNRSQAVRLPKEFQFNTEEVFIRKEGEDVILCVFNFTPVPRSCYRLGVPGAGSWTEVLNTDAAAYGGSNVGNLGGLQADAVEWQGRTHSIVVNLPPLAVIAFKREAPADSDEEP